MRDERSVPGAYKIKLARFEKFFSKIAPTLESFATDYNLLTEKYAHMLAEWAFLFRHPKGGVGQIEVILTEKDQSISAVPSWSIDIWRKGRLLKWGEEKPLSLEPQQLRECLESTLRTMVTWNREEMRLYEGSGTERETKGQLRADLEKYPVLKLG